MKKYVILLMLSIGSISMNALGQVDTLQVKTNTYCNHCAVCGSCGERMETELPFVKGIKLATYNEENMSITIIYNSKKITPLEIRKEVANLGFDADDVPANQEAYNKLDNCCKKK